MELDYSKSGVELMVGLINKTNGTIFTVNDLSFSGIGDYSDPDYPEKNTKIIATGTGTTRFTGPKEVYYRRLDLAVQFGGRNVDFAIKPTGSTFQGVLAQINDRFGLGLDATDVEWNLVDELITEDTEATLTALINSYTYVGSTDITLTQQPVDNTIIIEPETDPDAEVAEQFQTDDGMLLTGTNNPSGDLILTNNGEIQLGGTMRIYLDPAALEQPTPGHFDIVLEGDQDWNFTMVYGLIDTRNGDRLHDLYDLGLKVTAVDTGQELDFELVWDSASQSYHFNDDNHSLNITDGVTNAAATAYQDMQRLVFYKDELQITNLSAAGVPLGDFTFEFHATRKLEGSEPISNVITVTVTEAP